MSEDAACVADLYRKMFKKRTYKNGPGCAGRCPSLASFRLAVKALGGELGRGRLNEAAPDRAAGGGIRSLSEVLPAVLTDVHVRTGVGIDVHIHIGIRIGAHAHLLAAASAVVIVIIFVFVAIFIVIVAALHAAAAGTDGAQRAGGADPRG